MSTGIGWEKMPTLSTERLVLRNLREQDVEMVFEVFRDPDVMRYWSSPPMTGIAEAEALIRQIHDLFRAGTLFQWGIASRSSDAILGTCTLFHLDLTHRRGEIGFALGKQHWGQGIASEAVARLIALAFEELGLHRIEADVDPRNEGSLRLLERQGFQREGLLRERYQVGGEIQDAVFLGLLRPEWKGVQR
ncbi:MAG: GNAT family N-acetyltransferase [Bryobacterales bacterium]